MNEPLLRIEVDAQRKWVTATRTAADVPSAAAVSQTLTDARATLAKLPRGEHAILIDLRAAPLAVESRFADAFIALRKELSTGFRRAVFLVDTKVGLLQVQRFVREERLNAIVCDRLEDARRELL